MLDIMSAAGVGPIIPVQGTLSADFYKRLLIRHAVPNLQYLCRTAPQSKECNEFFS